MEFIIIARLKLLGSWVHMQPVPSPSPWLKSKSHFEIVTFCKAEISHLSYWRDVLKQKRSLKDWKTLKTGCQNKTVFSLAHFHNNVITRSSINDVTQFWIVFDTSSRFWVQKLIYYRHKIIYPYPLMPWRHWWTISN